MAYVQANTGFITSYGGEEVHVVEGDVFDEHHEVVRNNAGYFSPLNVRFAPAPEEATTKRKRVTRAAEVSEDDAAVD